MWLNYVHMKKLQILMLLTTALLFACQKPASYSSFDEYPVYEGDDLELTFTPEKSNSECGHPQLPK
jgi:hypothetical protein